MASSLHKPQSRHPRLWPFRNSHKGITHANTSTSNGQHRQRAGFNRSTVGGGLATSSKNATKTGLYAANDFIRPGEEAEYDALTARLNLELSPVTLLEENLTDEIRRAMWKLRRCAQVEGTFAAQLATDSEPIPDPMQNEAAAKLQNSVDRARAQSHRLLHRCTTELRRLQTDRLYLDEILPEGAASRILASPTSGQF